MERRLQVQKKGNRGNGIIVLVKYPIANHITKYRKIEGRILNLVLRMKRHKELSLYFIQAPTAPYGVGSEETRYLKSKIQEMIEADINVNREIIIGGDCNSYPDAESDYIGLANGQVPSELIVLFQSYGFIDMIRIQNDQPFYTFQGINMRARLDQYWVSPNMALQVVETRTFVNVN